MSDGQNNKNISHSFKLWWKIIKLNFTTLHFYYTTFLGETPYLCEFSLLLVTLQNEIINTTSN